MGFLKPLFLLGLSLASIPIIIHLFNRRRLKRVDFSSLFFLRDLKRERFNWLRLRELLLLIARTSLLFFLLFALARPYLQSKIFLGKRKASVAIVIDDSYSMGYRHTVSSFERVQIEAKSLIGQLASGSDVSIILASRVAEDLMTSRNLTAIRSRIDSLSVSFQATDLKTAVQKGLSLLENAPSPARELFVFTDLQRSSLLPGLTMPAPKGIGAYLVDVGDKAGENVGIVDVGLENPLPSPEEPTRIRVRIKNYTDKELTRRLTLTVNNENFARTEKLRPKEDKTVVFDKILSGPGNYTGSVEIDRDSLAADDRRYFAVSIPEKINVLLVYEKPEDIFYLQTALAPTSGSIFNVTTTELGNLKRTELDRFKVVALINPVHLLTNDWQRISRYLDQGGGVLVAVGEELTDGSWLAPFGSYEAFYLPAGFVTLNEIDYRHPIFQVFQGKLDPTKPKFFRIAKIKPNNSSVIARFSDGSPFFLQATNQQLIVATTIFDLDYTDLPFKTMFLPLVHRTFIYLAQNYLPSGCSVGDSLVVPVNQSSPWVVTTPEKTSKILPVRLGNRSVIRFSETGSPGIYRLGPMVFSINVAGEEGNLVRATETEIRRAGYQTLASVRAHKIDLTQPLVYLALFLLIAEMIIMIIPKLPESALFSKITRRGRKPKD